MTDEQFSQIVANIRKENKLDTEEQFQAALKQEGLTLPELRRNIERSMIVNRVQQQDVMDKISVTEAESAAYFDAHKDQFSTPAAVTLREILVAVPDRAPAGTAEAGQAGINVGLDERPRSRPRRSATASPPGGLRRRRRGELRCGVEGQRRPDRAGQPGRDVAEAAGGGEGPEGRREHAADPQPAWLSDHQARDPQRDRRPAARSRPQSGRRSRLPARRAPELAKYLERLREQAIIEWKNDDLKKAYEAFLAKPAVPTSSSN